MTDLGLIVFIPTRQRFESPTTPILSNCVSRPLLRGRKKDPVSLSPASEVMSRRAEPSFLPTFFKMPGYVKKFSIFTFHFSI